MFSFRKFDYLLLLPAIFLLGFGIGTISSVSSVNLPSHLFYILIGIIFFLIFSFVDYSLLSPFSPFIYILCIVFLILPFIFGSVTRGSVRWIPIGSYTLQPSEIVKPFFAIFCAWFWTNNKFSYKKLLTFLGLCLPVIILIFIQPDLGSTLVILSIVLGSIIFSGIRLKHIVILFAIFLLILPSSWLFLKDYQKLRFVHFLNPYSDPLGEGYNVIQSKITVGSGSIFGRGFGRGTQSHLSFLPERHTDFIFASLAEELGFAGSLMVLFLYFFLFFRIIRIAKDQSRLPFLIAFNILFYLSFQVVVNIGMNMGILPITGITLPLISYGGSSLLATLISLGMVESISRKREIEDIIEIR